MGSVRFTLCTDHRNLTFLDNAPVSSIASNKVKRWKIFIMEFDFEIQHIAGEKNIVADGLSRFIPDTCVAEARSEIASVLREQRQQSQEITTTTRASEPTVEERQSRRIVVSEELQRILLAAHSDVAGHFGVQETVRKVQRMLSAEDKPFPKGLHVIVKQHIRACPCCQISDPRHWKLFLRPFTLAAYEPMQGLAVDVMEFNTDEFGFAYCLVIIDCFTRFTEICPLQDKSALRVAKKLLEHVGRYGAFSELVSDQGREFIAEVIKEFKELMGFEHTFTIAYSKEENGLGERVNKEIRRHLKNILFDRKWRNQWSDCTPLVQRIINASPHSSIGVSPAQLLFGDAIELDRGIFLPFEQGDFMPVLADARVNRMLQRQQQLMDHAFITQLDTDEIQMHRRLKGVPKDAEGQPEYTKFEPN